MKPMPRNANVHPEASVHPSIELPNNVEIGCGTEVNEGAKLGPGVKIAERATIGKNTTLGANVQIGPETVIDDGVELADGVIVGRDCKILRGPNNLPTRINTNVTIGDGVEIAGGCRIDSNCSIADGVTVSDSVQIGINAEIGRDAVLQPRCNIGNDATVKREAEIGEECSVGARATIGEMTRTAPQSRVPETAHIENIANDAYRLAREFYPIRQAPAAGDRPDKALRIIDLYDDVPAAGLYPGLKLDMNDHWAEGTSLTDEVDAAIVKRRFPGDTDNQRDALLALAYHRIDNTHTAEGRIWVPANVRVWSVRNNQSQPHYIQAQSGEAAKLVAGMLQFDGSMDKVTATALT